MRKVDQIENAFRAVLAVKTIFMIRASRADEAALNDLAHELAQVFRAIANELDESLIDIGEPFRNFLEELK